MPPSFKDAQDQRKQQNLTIQALVFSLIAVGLFIGGWQMPTMYERWQIGQINAVAIQDKHEAKSVEGIQKDIDHMRLIWNRRIAFAQLSQILEEEIGGKVSVNTLTLGTDRVLSIEGFVAEGFDLDGLQSRLASKGLFSDVNLDYVNKRITQDGQWVYFKMTMRLISETKES